LFENIFYPFLTTSSYWDKKYVYKGLVL
jgi:hypothetical protein